MPVRILVLVILVQLGEHVTPAIAAGQRHALALVGDVAPGAGGGVYDYLYSPSLNERGEVAFWALLTGGTADTGVFVHTATTSRAVALQGQPAPGLAGGTLFRIRGAGPINRDGDVALVAEVSGTLVPMGVFVSSGESLSAVAFAGDVAPGTGGDLFRSFAVGDFNDARDLVVRARTTGSGRLDGIFRAADGGRFELLALGGEAVPGWPGAEYRYLGSPTLNQDGDVVFGATISSSTGVVDAVVQVDSEGETSIVVEEGELAPIYDAPFGVLHTSSVGVNDLGEVVFPAAVDLGATLLDGYWVDDGVTRTPLAFVGDPVSELPGAWIGSLSVTVRRALNDARTMIFQAGLQGAASGQGLFLTSVGRGISTLVLEGDDAPGTDGGVFDRLESPTIDQAGNAAFVANLAGGTSDRGIFFVPEADPISALAVGVLGLGCLGRRRPSRGVPSIALPGVRSRRGLRRIVEAFRMRAAVHVLISAIAFFSVTSASAVTVDAGFSNLIGGTTAVLDPDSHEPGIGWVKAEASPGDIVEISLSIHNPIGNRVARFQTDVRIDPVAVGATVGEDPALFAGAVDVMFDGGFGGVSLAAGSGFGAQVPGAQPGTLAGLRHEVFRDGTSTAALSTHELAVVFQFVAGAPGTYVITQADTGLSVINETEQPPLFGPPLTLTIVPEPGTTLLVGLGLGGLAVSGRRQGGICETPRSDS